MYQVNDAIEITYQAAGAASGVIIHMDVYDETHNLDATQSLSGMTEIGSTGRYYGSFTPDVIGNWTILMYEFPSGKGKVVKKYEVGTHDIDAVGTKTDALPADPASSTDISTTEDNIRGADSDTLETLSDQMDVLESPAMVG